jgi:3-oxoacyl-[acyl-carrier protein] reductase
MGKVAAPTMSTYSATKFAILGFTQALRGELSAHKLKVIALLPSLTDTDMSRGLKLFAFVRATTPQRVAQELMRGLERGSSEILVGWQSYLAVWGQRLAPWLLEKILLIAAPQKQSKPQTIRG